MAYRSNRIGEQMKKEVSQILREELKDPRVGFVTVTSVDVSGDLSYAKIYVSVLGAEEDKMQTLKALQKAQGFVRSELSKRLRLRYIPEVTFHFDKSIEHGARIMELLHRVQGEEKVDE